MKLEDCRKAYDYFSSSASGIARQLAFAGIAIIWIFKTDEGGSYKVPDDLILPGLLIVVGLALDFLHYISGAIIWGTYHRQKEKSEISEADDFLAPKQLNWPINTFFTLKILVIVVAYYFLIQFLVLQALA